MATDPNRAIYPLSSGGLQPISGRQDEPDAVSRAFDELERQKKLAEQRRLQETPADIKRRTQVARDLNMKPSEIVDLGQAERAVQVRRQMELREKYPAIGKAFNQNPALAGYMVGQEQELSTLGTIWDGLKKAPGRLFETGGLGVSSMMTSTLALASEVGALPTALQPAVNIAAQPARRIIEDERTASRERYSSDNFIMEGVLAGLESVPLTLAAVALRNPYAAAGAIGLGVGSEKVYEGRDKGLGKGASLLYGAAQGVPEAAFELLPMGELLKVGGRGFLSGFGKYMLAEVPGEILTTTAQSFTDWAVLPENKDRTFKDWALGLPEEYAQTVLGVLGGGTVTVTTAKGVEALGRFAQRRDAQRQMAAVGKFEGDFLDRLGGQLAGNSLRQEDPEAFASLMRDFAQDRGVSTVLVPGEAVRDYLQSSAFEGENDPLAPYQQAALEAAAAGNDIALPIETALTTLPGSKAWEALKDDMRLTAGGMSRRQAEALEANEEAMLDEFRKQAEETDSKAKNQTTSREARIAKITTKLEEDGGFAPAEAARQAELLVARMSTRAARMGRDDQAVDQAVENLRIRQVMPPELQRAMAAQEQDMVVAALRGNTKGSTSRARAAAAELQAVLARQGWTPEQLSDEQLGQVIERMRAAGENDGREYRADGERGRGSGIGRGQALADAPRVQGEQFGPIEGIVAAAEAYAQSVGIDLKRQAEYAKIDEAFATRLAEAYEALEHNPSDPAVAEAYDDLIRQTRAQYDALVAAGITFSFGDPDGPYFKSGWNALRDLRDNQHMQVFATKDGYGSDEEFNSSDNPLLVDTGLTWPDHTGVEQPVYANDLFRAVHDAFGHGIEGAGFRAEGEENAWQAHSRLFTGPALAALTSETRGQNSWVNYGPNGEFNRTASAEDTIYGDQKAGLLPSWAWTENVVPDMEPTDGRLDEALSDGESAALAAGGGIQIGWRPERIRDLLSTYGYNPAFTGNEEDAERSKAVAGRLTPDQFLGLTASSKGRRLIAERVEGMEDYGGGIDFDRMRDNVQPIFLIVSAEGGFTSNYRDDNGNLVSRDIPVSLRVVGHEGRHRMTMLKAAGVTSVPVVIIVQEARGKVIPESAELGPQRSRSDQVATGDASALVDSLVPISYANREKLAQEFGQGRELFQREFEQATWFYSALERAAESVKTERAPAAQWIATLKNAPGVKAEELEWTGIIDWLEAQTGAVDKSQVVETIQRGGIVIEEIDLEAQEEKTVEDVLEEYSDEIYERASDEANQEFEDEFVGEVVETIREDLLDIDRETPDLFDPEVGPPYQPPVAVKYSANFRMKYTDLDLDRLGRYMADFDGKWMGDGYDGIIDLGNFETKEAAQAALDEAKENLREYLFEYEDFDAGARERAEEYFISRYVSDGGGEGSTKWKSYSLADSDDTTYFEWLMRLPAGEGRNPDASPRTHWDQSGVVIHVRGHERRGADGKRILFLDEIQSDWHQKAASNFTDVKAEAVRRFYSDNSGLKKALDAGVPEPLYDTMRDAIAESKAHRAWPELAKWLEANPSEAGAALLQSVADANRGYMAQPDPVKIERLRKAEEDAKADLDAAYQPMVDATAELQEAIRPVVLARIEELREEKIENALDLNRLSDELRVIPRDDERYRPVQDAFNTANRRDDQIDGIIYSLEAAVTRPANKINLGDIPVAYTKAQMTSELQALEVSEPYLKAEIADQRWNRAMRDLNLREREHEIAKSGGRGIPDAPFRDTWPTVAIKRMIAKAAVEGYDQIAWIKQGENNGGMSDDVDWFYGRNLPNMVNKLLKPYKAKVGGVRVEGLTAVDPPRAEELREQMAEIDKRTRGVADLMQRTAAEGRLADLPFRIGQLKTEIARGEEDLAKRKAKIAEERALIEAGESEEDYILVAYEEGTAAKEDEVALARSAVELLSDTEEALRLFDEYEAMNAEFLELLDTAPTNLGFDITPELREAAASGFPLFQPDHRNMPRGRILFPGNDDQGAVIELFQGRDLSTLIHESSHLWLEELKADAADPGAPEQVKRDWQLVLDWFKANGHEVRDGIIPVGAHEMWARGGERYMREGKAPSVGLKRAFETFRSWLTNLYKTVRGLNSPITPEIREVFDRLLATDDEIAEARQMQGMEALFNTAVEAGMSPDEFANYQEQVASARAEAQGRVLEKAMADIAKRETRLGRERRRQIKDQVTKAAEDVPLFKALAVLREERMDRAALVERFGEDAVGQLPSRVPPLYAEGGTDPEIIAEMAGFNSAEDMVNAMVAAEADQKQAKAGGDKRNLKARFIDQMTDQAFAAQYGDPMTPEQMLEEAQDAVANDRQGEVIASEIAALARKSGKTPTPYQMARQWARGRVRQGVYVAEASKQALERHRRAIAAAGREAEQALLAGDMEAAYRAKQKQMLSSALLMEAKAAHEEVETARARMERIAKARTMKSVDQDYLEQAHGLLEEVDLKQRSQTSINEKMGFDEWLATRGDGEEVFVPDRLNWKGQPWSRLTVEQITGLDDTIKSIIHLGRFKQTMLDNQERRDFEAWRDEARAGLEGTPGRKIDEAKLNEEKSKLASIFSNLAKMEVVAKEMDNDTVGPWTRLLTWRASDAANYRDEMRDRVLKPIAAAYNALDNKARKRLAETVDAPGLLWKSPDINDPRNGTPIKLTRWNVLAMALNMGNQSSLEKLARGYGISIEYAEAIAMDNLNEQEWAFVQSVWDSLELLWPDIAKAEQQMSGVAPERVEVRPIRTPFGELRGGYYPVVYDPSSSQKAEDNLNDATADLFGKRSGVATASGHTKARTGYAAPILLSPEAVIFQHVEKVITRNAYAPWVRDVLRAIKEPSLRAMIDRKLGPELRQMIEPWLRQQVREGAANEAMTGVEAFLRSARVNVTVVSMGLRWSTGVAQTIGLANSVARVGLTGMQRGIRKMLQNPVAAQEFVFSRSPEMARRNEAMNRDVAEAFRVMRLQARGGGPIKRTLKGWQSKAQTMAFWHIGMIDRWIVSMPTWLGAYENAIRAGATDEEASRAGDSAVRLSQGSGVEKDLSAWQSNQSSEALKFLTMFYTPFNVLLNAQWEATRSARRGDWRKASMIAFWMMIATPLFDALLAGDVPDDDDEEGWASWLARNIGTYQMAGIPILRDVASYGERKFIGEYATFGPGPLSRIFSSSEKAAQLAWDGTLGEDEISETWLRTAIETPGFFLGLPTGQVSQTSQFLYDVGQGTQRPETFGDWYQGMTKGKIKED